jgi:putative DNA primase/helicase
LAEAGDDVADWLDCYGGTADELTGLADEAALATAAPLVELEAESRDATASGFFLTANGLWFCKADPGGETQPVWLADPIRVEADTVGDGGREWGQMLRWKDRAGNDHRWPMPRRILASDAVAVRAVLVDRGLNVTSNQKLRERLADYLMRYPASGPLIRCSSRVGWQTGGGYLLPGWFAAPQETDELVYQSPTGETGAQWRTGGTAAEWREKVGLLCVGNSRLVLAACIGFGGPLLELAGADGGGFHLVGQSSVGRSTALVVAASVCGGGPDGGPGVHSSRTTANGLEALAAAHNADRWLCGELAGAVFVVWRIEPIRSRGIRRTAGAGRCGGAAGEHPSGCRARAGAVRGIARATHSGGAGG